MADKEKKTPASSDALFFMGLIGIILLSLFGPFDGEDGGTNSTKSSSRSSSGYSRNITENSNTAIIQGEKSPWVGKVLIERGNAASEYQPYKEYISLRTRGLKKGETINLTGWSLTNGKDARFYQLNDTQVRGRSDRVYIPQASKVFLTTGKNYSSSVIVGPSTKVVLLTGNVPNKLPFEVTSFQVNKCSGYIEQMDNYRFFPSISSSCPDPEKVVDVNTLDDSCYEFIRSLRTCRTPEFPERTKVGDHYEYGYVDGVGGLSNQCKTILKTHFNYNSCVALHGTDPDFLKNEWRIFLNRPWELWAKTRETITLYDNLGRVVDELSY